MVAPVDAASSLPLRILYTLNASPEYVLARTLNAIPCVLLPHPRVALHACLAALCRSSPELVHDPTRDFSVYLRDPLEPALSVALGLMSWALAEQDDGVLVNGSLVQTAAGPALEVVLALRESTDHHAAGGYSSVRRTRVLVHSTRMTMLYNHTQRS
ncbi:hypothetical protein PLICRDRAFT_227941 [Plicaturopsis crispa FD-325 SS-3]|nr:hypothetical protein PLICRDRAFT_227941 [Plicaturopsis crispa FD-325 SS-3]